MLETQHLQDNIFHQEYQDRSSGHFSYITQVPGTTKSVYKNYSHGQKPKIRIFERPPPSNRPEIVHHTFRHSRLIVPRFQEDPAF